MKTVKISCFLLISLILFSGLAYGADVSYETCTPPSEPYQHYLYLDGHCTECGRIKTYPSKHGRKNANWREWQSPIRYDSIPDGYYPAFTSLDMAREHLDTQALTSLNLPTGMRVTLINIKRDKNGQPYYRYFSNEADPQSCESWSASKFMLVPAAAARIRRDSNNKVGINSTTNSGEHVGELVTYLHNYSRHGNYESNALARYFLDVAGRSWANSLIKYWVAGQNSALGANYGAFYTDVSKTFSDDGHQVRVNHKYEYGGGHKMITTLGSAEFLKRLVMHREDSVTRIPGFRAEQDAEKLWEDLKILFYGQPDWYWGGMQDGLAIYLENAVDIKEIDKKTNGNWRIFSKLGFGVSSSRYRREFVYNAYGCFPQPSSPTPGNEFVISVHYSRPTNAIGGIKMDKNMQAAIKKIVRKVMNDKIDDLAAPPNDDSYLHDIRGHWAEARIRTLARKNIVTGYNDGTFKPDKHLTRAEFATIVDSAFNLDPQVDKISSDSEGHWAENAIAKVTQAGFFAGSDKINFRPNEKLTKLEAITALVNGLNYSAPENYDLSQKYKDADKIPQSKKRLVAAASQAGIIKNHPLKDWLEPKAHLTRAEAAVYIYEILEEKGRI